MSERPGEAPAILQNDVGAFYRRHGAAIDAAVARVLASGWYVLGREGASFEAEFADAFGLGEAIGVGNGTDALVVALRALGVGAGDRVATVSHTAVATVAAIELAGAEAVLVDIDPADHGMDPAALAAALDADPAIRTVVVVHLYGQMADMDAILAVTRARGIRVVEDCAQAHGAMLGGRHAGTLGDVATFSFYPTKNLGAIGDGGLVATRDPAIAERARILRQYGWRQRYVSDVPGLNSRLDELQAAILRAKLPHLAAGNDRRRAIAEAYREGLRGTGIDLPVERPGRHHVYHQFVIRHPERDRLAAALGARGIGTNIHYPVPVHRQTAYAGRVAIAPGGLAQTETAARVVLSLPMYPELGNNDVTRVIEAVRSFV